MGLFSFIGSIFGGNSQKKAVDRAAQATIDYQNRVLDLNQHQYDTTRADYMPYTTAGTHAITELDGLVDGSLSGADLAAKIKANPLYEAEFNNGEEALLQTASATGGLRGGDTARATMNFGADTLSKVYQQILSNLSGVAGLGLGATGSVASAGQANVAGQTAANTNIGEALASKYLTKGGINAGMWQNFGDLLDGKDLKSLISGSGGVSKALASIF